MPPRSTKVDVAGALVPVNGKLDETSLLFDRQPIHSGFDAKERGGFRLMGRSVEPVGRPTIKGFQEALAFACEFHESSPYWIGGLLEYSESRADWAAKLSQAMTVTGLARKTLQNLGYLYRKSTPLTRAVAPSPAHLAAVVTLPEAEQVTLLEQARREELTVKEVEKAVKHRHRATVIEGQAASMYVVDVTVEVTIEALNATAAEDAAWAHLKEFCPSGSRVIAAKARHT